MFTWNKWIFSNFSFPLEISSDQQCFVIGANALSDKEAQVIHERNIKCKTSANSVLMMNVYRLLSTDAVQQ